MSAPTKTSDGRSLAAVSAAHFMVDAYSNMYAPLLPLLMPRLGMSLRMAGTLMMVFQASSALSQLGFGRLADRGHARLLIMAGPLVCAVVLSLIGLVNHQATLAVVLVAGGLGVAAFHPPGAMIAHTAGRARPGTAMSVFITSGTLGFAMAPLLVANAAGTFGLGATVWFLIPGLASALAFARAVRGMPLTTRHRATGGLRALRPQARNLFILYAIVVLRTFVSLSFATFVPVLLVQQGMSVGEAGSAMALYLFMTGVGGFWGGTLADRFGPRTVIVWSLLLATPFLLIAPWTTGWTFAMLLSVGGLFLQSTLPVNVSFGQALAPHSAATVSSLMMGVAWGSGGMMIPLAGWAGDAMGLPLLVRLLGAVPLAACALATRLPAAPHTAHVEPVEVSVPAITPAGEP